MWKRQVLSLSNILSKAARRIYVPQLPLQIPRCLFGKCQKADKVAKVASGKVESIAQSFGDALRNDSLLPKQTYGNDRHVMCTKQRLQCIRKELKPFPLCVLTGLSLEGFSR
ncbi:hypothetical protein POPTR_014G042550v4 [Populus trichocarpa]|uniref:Uncharacterized protein n=1 Tax=Populus trichocarpa TaxID=3694 RepID=A0A3N7HHR3_POPTR|nr:hypothetical protein POPTR_014G042550v4 [Populus trichocarpa]